MSLPPSPAQFLATPLDHKIPTTVLPTVAAWPTLLPHTKYNTRDFAYFAKNSDIHLKQSNMNCLHSNIHLLIVRFSLIYPYLSFFIKIILFLFLFYFILFFFFFLF